MGFFARPGRPIIGSQIYVSRRIDRSGDERDAHSHWCMDSAVAYRFAINLISLKSFVLRALVQEKSSLCGGL